MVIAPRMQQAGDEMIRVAVMVNDVADVEFDDPDAIGRAVVGLLGRWNVSSADACILMGEIADTTRSDWSHLEEGEVGNNRLARMRFLLEIHRALRAIFADAGRAERWINAPNAAFDGRTALEVMLADGLAGITRVRSYLEAERAA